MSVPFRSELFNEGGRLHLTDCSRPAPLIAE